MTATIDPRQQFLVDIFVTANEGGIGYWATTIRQSYKPASPYLYILDREALEGDEPAHKKYMVTASAIETALAKIVEGKVTMDPQIADSVLTANATNDAGDIDSVAADVIVQVALFGEIVYG